MKTNRLSILQLNSTQLEEPDSDQGSMLTINDSDMNNGHLVYKGPSLQVLLAENVLQFHAA